ncbi:hypothetical protein EON65_30235 [archaeon]|nr:MAG: hypothetical protein EON65_30235 [archaeon]
MEEALKSVCDSIDEVYAKIDGSDEIGAKLKERLRKGFTSPPLEDFEKLVGKSLSVEEAQRLLFDPTHYHVGLYSSALWSAATGSFMKSDQSAQKTHALLLALIYLHHRCDIRYYTLSLECTTRVYYDFIGKATRLSCPSYKQGDCAP